MSRTEHLRTQHSEMVAIVQEVSKDLNEAFVKGHASEIRIKIATLVGKLKIHLATEDKVLYPPLLQHKDARTKAVAESFLKEMGGIAPLVEAYFTKWKNPTLISSDALNFIKETRSLFDALAKRIEREHKDLYPLLDAA